MKLSGIQKLILTDMTDGGILKERKDYTGRFAKFWLDMPNCKHSYGVREVVGKALVKHELVSFVSEDDYNVIYHISQRAKDLLNK